MKKLVIIDGNAILHRAYHALPFLNNKKGEPVNAVYGFASMLLRVITYFQPVYLAVVFDRPGPNFRQQMFANYQANRPAMEKNLVSQVDKVHQLVKDLGMAIYELDGYEADDVIGTIVTQSSNSTEKIIVTGDQDILQLVDQTTKVYLLTQGLSQIKLYGIEEIKKKYGFWPWQKEDFKALIGDASDNYRGVSGIGPKTAKILLSHFANLEAIYQNLAKLKSLGISSRVVKALEEQKAQAELCQKLATIVKKTPLDFNLSQTSWQPDWPKIKKVLADFGFQSLLKRIEPKNTSQPKESVKQKNQQISLFNLN